MKGPDHHPVEFVKIGLKRVSVGLKIVIGKRHAAELARQKAPSR